MGAKSYNNIYAPWPWVEHGGGKSNYILGATASTRTWGGENIGGGGKVISCYGLPVF